MRETTVDVWRGRFAEHAADAAAWDRLRPAERLRAQRFLRREDRERFVVAHALLRSVLAGYVARPPETLEFTTNPFGKPTVHAPSCARAPFFNMTHSGDIFMIAVADVEVGVDCEQWSEGVAYDQVAALVFSPRERRELAAVPASLKQRAFFTGWTRKEAYLKALGVGFSGNLSAFDVSLDPAAERPLIADRLAGATGRWTIGDVAVDAGYSASLAAASPSWSPVCRTLLAAREVPS